MELKSFVEQTLVQIVHGIHDAQGKAASFGGAINPLLAEELDPNKRAKHPGHQLDKEVLSGANLLLTHMNRVADMVEFDIAITVAETSKDGHEKDASGKAGFNISVLSAEIGKGVKSTKESERSDSRVSRVKFRVPVSFPNQR